MPDYFSRKFILLCVSNFFFFAGFNMIIPELPSYLELLGGADYKGLIIGLFTLTAMLSRPFSGKLTDVWGRSPVMLFGAVASTICGFLYTVELGIGFFFFLRLLHGFSTGFTPTGVTACIDDIVPNYKRGEAIGYVGIAGTMGMAAGPALGGWIAVKFNMVILFYVASFISAIATVLLSTLKETNPNAGKFKREMLRISLADLIERKALAPAITVLFLSYTFGVLLTIIPDYSKFLNIENKGVFFGIFTMSSLLIRLIAGKYSDRFGRNVLIIIGGVLLCLANFLLMYCHTATQFYLAAICVGISIGAYSPVIYAWAIDLAGDASKGRFLSTVFITIEFGIGSGALLSAYIFQNDINRIPYVFGSALLFSAISVLFLIYLKIKKHPQLR